MNGIGEGLLLREHAHRVANDMAVASAALRFAECRTGSDPALSSVIARLEATARVQRLLCEGASGRTVDLADVLTRLCDAMRSAHAAQSVALDVVAHPLPVADGDAWILSMCVHELVGNALRHGGASGARVRVEAFDGAGTTTVRVLDRGGMREWSRPGGQGAAIVDQLAARLGGRVRRSVDRGGGCVEIAVPTIAVAAADACVEV
ncbi:ATP-binding protein [Sphingomonas lacusdianchii]|uniref:ATP-binding protein n=1 Tax=Sphingomonas lacusdianchii TaxID=2917992 RepID=UPI001F57029D|nr:sensor histidine kinase [Sphingomonas sp. JXJ CY 53]